ncbi:MAG: sigma-70 family RNA polymerase sigma factor [Clostridia bacterium]|nr:sigma-70 family RNA polymerase sigma factor [Clostridia bacterium]
MNGLEKGAQDALVARYIHSRDPDLRDEVVRAYLPAARSVARKFAGRGVDEDDLFQVASLAMVKALDRFDPEKGVKFVSYVIPSMVGEVRNYFRDSARLIRLPRRGVQLAAQVNRARGELEQALERSPRADEIADRLNVRLEDVLEALGIYNHRTISLDSEDEETPIENFVGAEDAALEAFETSEQLAGAMSALSERERSVIRMRFFENLSQRQIAEKLNLSQMTVSRVERQALDALKKNIK